MLHIRQLTQYSHQFLKQSSVNLSPSHAHTINWLRAVKIKLNIAGSTKGYEIDRMWPSPNVAHVATFSYEFGQLSVYSNFSPAHFWAVHQ